MPQKFPIDSRPDDGFVLTLWTNDATLARRADAAGVQRIGVDLERLGKAERQQGLGTWLSPHTERDLEVVAAALTTATPFARVNPLNADSGRETDTVIATGARVLMLPMVTSPGQAADFVGLVAGRARIVLLVECREALEQLPALTCVAGIDEVHIGLNDLALSLGLPNRWLVLAGDAIADAGACVLDAGLRFGLGGIGRAQDESLPIPSDLVYAEYARTGATAAVVSRSFHADTPADLPDEIRRARARLAYWRSRDAAELAAAHAELGRRVKHLGAW